MPYAITMTCPFEGGAAAELHAALFPTLYPSTLAALRAAFAVVKTADILHPALAAADEEV